MRLHSPVGDKKGLEERLAGNPALSASLKANTKKNARLTFDHVVKDQL